ncbi:hypothetical protein PABG_07583 [Paracoccidioides brasiliensis Pb03]|uniref:Cytidyltransferase-like domain-containing protein n=1 Tax=Paracoccidioides brasiliensis (strain Pb18) TaxID=502780 RepID=C1GLS9_PARBD|nr:nicotinamide-nucleotide adenylyltransferase [Paracoccidioides brasiliensis Pb18]EEH18523.1 hypothetical protein PABG_07583 [Paracoccidioides brasiliensis Pb03]EEH43395.1 hypothetical protein PADG_08320 [Paracoccidioides brasiliensis Pb18]ODH46495.1 hypothetical protein GX48_07432 [Paracoccidioides brasiliensis]
MASKPEIHYLHELRQTYRNSLLDFIASFRVFQVLDSVRGNSLEAAEPVKLYILDSSFNPPTIAHLNIVKSAFAQHDDPSSIRLLLLLATQNADKPSKPASFEDRLVMMQLFAQDIKDSILRIRTSNDDNAPKNRKNSPNIDIGVTKLPYFIDKAEAISTSKVYPESLEQVLLTGYDTLVRIFDTKYYPPTYTLQPLSRFFSKNRLRVTFRQDDDWGGQEDQELFLRNLAQGARELEGGKREWADRIELSEGKKPGEKAVSSTKARNAAINKDINALKKLVTPNVCEWVLSQKLYEGS